MTLIKIQNTMSSEIAKRSFFSRPPEPPAWMLLNDPFKAVYIGTTKIFKVPFTWSFINLVNPHIAVVGITGSGKSYFVKSFLLRANYTWGTSAVIIDWSGEYKAWVKGTQGVVVSFSKGDYLNIMDLSGMRPIDRAKQIITSLEILTDIGSYPEQRRITAEAVEQSYLNAGFNISEAPPPGKEVPTLKDVVSLLEEKLQENTYQYPAELENAIYRIREFTREGEDYFSKKSTIDIGKLTQSGMVDIDLSGLPDERFRALAALFILQTLKEIMRSEGWLEKKGLKALVVLDEAWKVASDQKSDAITIVREGRKYQFGLIVASQNPTDVSETIFSNVGTSFILRIKFEKFMNYLQGSLNFSDYIKNEISKFGVGQAAVEMGFQTSLKFPDTFLLEKIHGAEPLYVYTIDMSELLTTAEISSSLTPKEFEFEEDEFKSRLIEYNIAGDVIEVLLSKMDEQARRMKIEEFITLLIDNNVNAYNIVSLLKSLSLEDVLITRIITKSGVPID